MPDDLLRLGDEGSERDGGIRGMAIGRATEPGPLERVYWQLRGTTEIGRLYGADPVGFVRDCFTWEPGEGPTGYQVDIMQELVARRRAAVRSPHNSGKTALASWLTLWMALTCDATVLSDW